MKAFSRRLHHLEHKLCPHIDLASQRAADPIRERLRQRLEAAGHPCREMGLGRRTCLPEPACRQPRHLDTVGRCARRVHGLPERSRDQ
jgi:hypothetical protein